MQANSFAITAQSAAFTLRVCNRQARRDTIKSTAALTRIVQILTGKQAARTYRSIWNLLVLAGMTAVALGMSARDVWESLNAYVESCIEQPVEPVVTVVDSIVPFVRRKVQPAQSLTITELRKSCQQQNIKWRNAHGKNQHLNKAEMLTALSSVAA